MVIPPLLVRHEKRLADKERTFVTHVTKSAIPDRVPLTPTPPSSAKGSISAVFGNSDPAPQRGEAMQRRGDSLQRRQNKPRQSQLAQYPDTIRVGRLTRASAGARVTIPGDRLFAAGI